MAEIQNFSNSLNPDDIFISQRTGTVYYKEGKLNNFPIAGTGVFESWKYEFDDGKQLFRSSINNKVYEKRYVKDEYGNPYWTNWYEIPDCGSHSVLAVAINHGVLVTPNKDGALNIEITPELLNNILNTFSKEEINKNFVRKNVKEGNFSKDTDIVIPGQTSSINLLTNTKTQFGPDESGFGFFRTDIYTNNTLNEKRRSDVFKSINNGLEISSESNGKKSGILFENGNAFLTSNGNFNVRLLQELEVTELINDALDEAERFGASLTYDVETKNWNVISSNVEESQNLYLYALDTEYNVIAKDDPIIFDTYVYWIIPDSNIQNLTFFVLDDRANLQIGSEYNFDITHRKWLKGSTDTDVIAANAYSQANNAFNTANSAFDIANSAYNQANNAFGKANNAFNTANNAFATANSAYVQANNAFGKANNAFATANSAYVQANNAFEKANDAFDTANSAYVQANNAFGKANNAFNTANSAFDTANNAFDIANNAFDTANISIKTIMGTNNGNVTIPVYNNTTRIGNITLTFGY